MDCMIRSCRSNVALALSLAFLLPTAAACHRYVPPEGGPASIDRGDPMRVSLSSPVSVDLGEISVDDAVLVSGELIELKEDGSIVMSVSEAKSPSGATRAGVGETVTIPADAIASVEKRVVNPVTTALVVVVIAGAATVIGVTALNSGSGGNENGNGGPPPPEEDERSTRSFP